MSEGESAPVKVAILGGGIGGLSAALALTDPSRKRRYEVTVYTMGWRLGGKGASGRNPEFGQRIEEHGIHVWFGFYENAFKWLSGCYDSLTEQGWLTPEGRPCALSQCIGEGPEAGSAFYPHEHFVVNEQRDTDGSWSMWRVRAPRNGLVPGDGTPVPSEISLAYLKIKEMLAAATEIRRQDDVELMESAPASLPKETAEESAFRRYVERHLERERQHEGVVDLQPEDYFEQALDGLAAPELDQALAGEEPEGGLEGFFDAESRFRLRLRFIAWALRCARTLIRPWDALSDRGHRLYLLCDTFAAIATGLVRTVFTGLGDPEDNLRRLDDLELREWLKEHGADADYLASNPSVRFIYNSAFAFVDGDHRRPSIAAGAALQGVLRLFLGYKGAFAYRMSAGMGDVVFSPIYCLLRRRGVKFEFFHRVEALRLGEVGRRPFVDAIAVTRQASGSVAEYDPFVWVNALPCWPHKPLFDQLENGEALAKMAEDGIELEDPRVHWPGERARLLRHGHDFDEVVLAIPVGALPPITTEIQEHPTMGPRWNAMLRQTATTPTQAFQLWFRASLRDLGWNDPPPVFGTYIDPIDTYIDMTPALHFEHRRADDVKSLAYFCGVLDRRAGESHGDALARARRNAIEYLARCDYMWPVLGQPGGSASDLLWGAVRGRDRAANFSTGQYVRANVLPSELYTLNLPGTSRYRLRPDAAARSEGSAFCRNLWLAGDWTRNPIDLGCVEAAVMSGLSAARGLSGEPIEIIGEHSSYIWSAIGRGDRSIRGHSP